METEIAAYRNRSGDERKPEKLGFPRQYDAISWLSERYLDTEFAPSCSLPMIVNC